MGDEERNTDVAQRIASLMESLGMKTADFAEKVGIQKSAVSHLLGGRNKPSFEVIGSMLVAFPELNPDWLILGKGDMWRKHESTSSTKTSIPNQNARITSLKGLVNAAPLPSTPIQLQGAETIAKSGAAIKKDTYVNNTQANSTIQSEKTQKEHPHTPITNVTEKPNQETTCVTYGNSLPDIVVLQPDGRYVRYRAIKE